MSSREAASGHRPTWVEIHLGNLAHNVREVKRRIGNRELMAVVKADAYGHGAVPCAITALEHGVSYLGVAFIEEAIQLRKAGIASPILVLGSPLPEQAPEFPRFGVTCTVASAEVAEALSYAATAQGKKARVHVKVDTGMGRLGIRPEDAVGFVSYISRLANLEIEGIFTHFATADEEDKSYARSQLQKFKDVIAALEARGIRIPIKHAANSAAILELPDAGFDMVRLGIAMYGLSAGRDVREFFDAKPVLSFKTRIVYLKRVPAGFGVSYGITYRTEEESLIATLPVGYADGLSRALSNKGEVLIGGKRFPIVGRICMDQCMVRLPVTEPVEVGQEAVIIGKQMGAEIRAEEVARKIGTIPYEVTCMISKRVPRIYVDRP